MAIYHFSVNVISRSSGSSATAAAAYRAGEKIVDERTGEIHDYTRKKGVDSSWILAPESAPDWVFNREKLWNEVESVERRRDSQLAREINVALPTELDMSQQLELVREFVNEQFIGEGMVADIACHDLDTHNPHAHIMLTMRGIDEQGFNAKKNRDWNKKELLEKQRLAWTTHANKALEMAGVNQTIDHRSLEAQGAEHIPQIHLGVAVNAMRKRGITTEREEQYLEIEAANKEIKRSQLELENIKHLESSYSIDSSDRNSSEIESVPPAQSEPEDPNIISLEQQKQLSDIANRYLKYIEHDVWNSKNNSKFYNLRRDSTGLLVIEDKKGREVLYCEQGQIVRQQSTEKDIEHFKKVGEFLDKKEKMTVDTANRYLEYFNHNVWDSILETKIYHLRRDSTRLLVTRAEDNREVLYCEQGQVVRQQLTNKDVKHFEKAIELFNKEEKKVADTAVHILLKTGETDILVTNNSSDSSCKYRISKTKGLLVVKAKDGRGEILRREKGIIMAEKLTVKDAEEFKKFIPALESNKKASFSSNQKKSQKKRKSQ